MCSSKLKIALCALIAIILLCCFTHTSDKEILTKTSTNSKEIVKVADLDGDKIADSNDTDIDGDGVLNSDEEKVNSDPFNKDSDGDGKLDGDEFNKDSDKDGVSDIIESAKKDRDKDGVVDELDSDDSSVHNDSDGDGFDNITEKTLKTDPLNPNSKPALKNTNKDANSDKIENSKDSNINEKNTTTNLVDAKAKSQSKVKSEHNQTNSTLVQKNITIEEEKKKVVQEIQDVLKIENIEFEVDSSTITQKGIETIKKIYIILKKYPDTKLEIDGYTDSDGDAQYNLKLSQERVDAVKKALVEFGLDGNRFTTKGYGESKPLVPNNSAENKAKNRRVEFILIGE